MPAWTPARRKAHSTFMKQRMQALWRTRRNFHFNNVQQAIERTQQDLSILKQAEGVLARLNTQEDQ